LIWRGGLIAEPSAYYCELHSAFMACRKLVLYGGMSTGGRITHGAVVEETTQRSFSNG